MSLIPTQNIKVEKVTSNEINELPLVPISDDCKIKSFQQGNLSPASSSQICYPDLKTSLHDSKNLIESSDNPTTDEIKSFQNSSPRKSQPETKSNDIVYRWPYKCDICFQPFDKIRAYITHYYTHHIRRINKKISLRKLLSLYNTPQEDLKTDTEYPNHKSVLKCKICKKDFKEQWLFELHSLSHINGSSKSTHIEINKLLPLKLMCDNVPSLVSSSSYKDINKSIPQTILAPTPLNNIYYVIYPCTPVVAAPEIKSESVLNLPTDETLNHSKFKDELDKYVCEVCKKSFTEKYLLKMHKLTHGIEVVDIKCKICSEVFSNRNQLLKHEHKFHSEDFPHACSLCPKRFRRHFLLSQHLCFHTKIYPFTCSVCKKGFTSNAVFKNHTKMHEEGKLYQCDLCDLSFQQRSRLVNHYAVHFKRSRKKSEVTLFACDDCDRTFKNRYNLKVHSSVHTGKIPSEHVCNDCGKTFNNVSNRKRHELIHRGVKFYTCDFCKRGFDRKQKYTDHLNTHTGERPYECDLCDLKFCQKIELTQHTVEHTGIKPYCCEICPKSFNNKGGLRNHVKGHLNLRSYKCNACPKAFKSLTDLKSHCRIHTGEKPYVCEECHKGLSSRYALKIHLRIHTGEKPYECDTCHRTFRVKKCFVDHFKTHPDCKAPSTI